MNKRQAGFTLVELILVIVLIGIIGGVLVLQLVPAIRNYLLVGQRAALTDQADTALRGIVGEVRSAVPNSLRLGSSTCLELVPTKDGGRYRTAPHIPAAGAPDVPTAHLDDIEARPEFDVLSVMADPPVNGDAIVVGNQNPDDVYKGVDDNRVNVGIVDTATVSANAAAGTYRIRLSQGNVAAGSPNFRLPVGYDGGRFVVVPGQQKSVSYVCDKPGLDTTGDGTGTLYRYTSANLNPTQSCTLPPVRAVVARKVAHCAFQYSPGQGATQESGYIQLQLTLSSKGEAAPLTIGAHVDNVP